MSYGKATAAPSHITDLIFIGSRRHAANLTADNPSAINAVLNVGSGRYAREDSIEYKHVPLPDAGPIPPGDLTACISFIRTHVDQGRRILVHCNAGRNRSPAIAIGYLLATGQSADWNDAFHFVKSKRECVGVRVAIRESVLSALGEPTNSIRT